MKYFSLLSIILFCCFSCRTYPKIPLTEGCFVFQYLKISDRDSAFSIKETTAMKLSKQFEVVFTTEYDYYFVFCIRRQGDGLMEKEVHLLFKGEKVFYYDTKLGTIVPIPNNKAQYLKVLIEKSEMGIFDYFCSTRRKGNTITSCVLLSHKGVYFDYLGYYLTPEEITKNTTVEKIPNIINLLFYVSTEEFK